MSYFGRRFIRQSDFISYARQLGLGSFLERRLEFAERIGLVTPVARIRYPDTVVRRWYSDRYEGQVITAAVEADGAKLEAANSLRRALSPDQLHWMRFGWRQRHPLDAVAKAHRQFVTKAFSPKTFAPWSTFRTLIGQQNGHDFYDNDGFVTYYHGWQVFLFAAFLRSGVKVQYDVFSQRRLESPLDLSRADIDLNEESGSYHELKALRENAVLFDAVARYCDLSNRALQVYAHDVVPNTRQLSEAASRSLHSAEAAIARRVVATARLRPGALIKFIQLQCQLWDDAVSHHPARVAEEYKRNIGKTIEITQRAYPRYSASTIIKRVRSVNGWHQWVLEVIFPDWVREQRQSVEPSLQQWIVPRLAQMSSAFAFANKDVADFCTWIERAGLLQFYWHFRRLMEIGPFDDPIERAAATAEVVGLASLIEHMVNEMLRQRKPRPTSVLKKTLGPKVRALLRANHGALDMQVHNNSHLTSTEDLPLRRQLTRIEKARFVGPNAPVLRTLLRLLVIRNASTHEGLPGFSRADLHGLNESLLVAALVLWKAR